MEYLSYLVLALVLGLLVFNVFNGRTKPPTNVLPFRRYHRIEWLQKRRKAKLKSRLGGKL